MDNNFLVRVSCMTFNHAPYIEDAMNGFCMQETTFPFVCTIMDDASTDGEPEVIKKYLQQNFDLKNKDILRNEETEDYVMTFAQHKTNINCFFAVYFLKYNHYGKKSKMPYIAEWNDPVKYIAVCEGDDYWIVSSKLQKQVDILNENPDVMMVYTNFETVDKNGNIVDRPQYDIYRKLSKSGDILPALIKSNFPMTLTVLTRKDVYDSKIYKDAPSHIDYMLFVSSAFLGNAVFIKEKTACYRNEPNSMMNAKQSKIIDCYKKIKPYIYLEYAKGMCKKISFRNDIIIKHRIISKSLDMAMNNYLILSLIKTNKSFIFFLFTGYIIFKMKELKRLLFFAN